MMDSLANRKGFGPGRWNLKSERLWEDAPPCSGYSIRYRSETVNKNKEPVFYTREEPYLVPPVLRPRVAGCFSSNPGGLNLDPRTGEIDINNSDTGIRYKVDFMPCGKPCTAQTSVVIGGIGYEGGVFSLSSNEALVSNPFYYGSNKGEEVPSRRVPPGRFGYIPEGVKPTANLLGLKIDEKTGMIDLKATIKNGGLGFRGGDQGLPENGSSKEFKVYYRLDTTDRESRLSHTTLRIHYFDTVDLIPEELLARITQQKNSIHWQSFTLPLMLGSPFTWFSDAPWDILMALGAALSSLLLLNTHKSDNPLRPPEHCVTL
jgi:hypothetical protein